MKTELKVGDKLFAESRYRGLSVVTVDRLTKTTAVLSDGEKLDNPTFDHVSAKGSRGGFGTTYYRFVTEDLTKQYERQNALRKIKSTKWDNYTTEQITAVIAQLNTDV